MLLRLKLLNSAVRPFSHPIDFDFIHVIIIDTFLNVTFFYSTASATNKTPSILRCPQEEAREQHQQPFTRVVVGDHVIPRPHNHNHGHNYDHVMGQGGPNEMSSLSMSTGVINAPQPNNVATPSRKCHHQVRYPIIP